MILTVHKHTVQTWIEETGIIINYYITINIVLKANNHQGFSVLGTVLSALRVEFI